ncbi:MAG: hypothetical protein PHU63_02825 [Candidatus ainarchaeum sp.]|nr:hypothetical protein [Candidatus ainarchaeum sp.]
MAVKKKSKKIRKVTKKQPKLRQAKTTPKIEQPLAFEKTETIAIAPSKVSQEEKEQKVVPYFASLSYLVQIFNFILLGIGPVISILIFLVSDKKFTKFHAVQSALLGFLVSLLFYILKDSILLGTPLFDIIEYGMVYLMIGVLSIFVFVLLGFKTYKNQWVKLPLFGDLAMRYS